ncbi:MAG: hypothetical protein SPLUMA1_SPLUMAMAG1_00192 [uncultured Sulfurimonas sp.]|nr:MAG: hypothetical protein SPLUMA1_SPLUMAMAG1_00192 [uncultured Sulfurimonas sp.]
MNTTKLSLVAALLIGSSAMALENTKVTGDANLYYQTEDTGAKSFLAQDSSIADISVNLNLTTDIIKTDSVTVSAGLGYTMVTTLGLEGQLVSGTWGNAHDSTAVDTVSWINEAWLATTLGNTTAKVGRMELDTPLAFTEKWTIEKNTFESAVLINTDISNTTLVGAYVGRGNGNGNGQGVVATGAEFTNYGGKGAYVVGAINNSLKPLTLQAWYYDIVAVAQASWLQADLSMNNIVAGAQYTTLSLNDSSAAAAMVGYKTDIVSAQVSYSQVSTKGDTGYNTATSLASSGNSQTKLYTDAWWNYGQVTMAGAKTVHLTLEAPTAVADLALFVTSIDHVAANTDLLEVTATVTKSMGPIDATLAYIYTDIDNSTDASNIVQVYLTANF